MLKKVKLTAVQWSLTKFWNLQVSVTTLKSDSHLPKNFFSILFNENSLKMMKNVFLFHLKSLFCPKDIESFA